MYSTRFGFALAATKPDKATRFLFQKVKNLTKTTNRDLVRCLGHLLGPAFLLMPFSMGGGFFVTSNIFKKIIQLQFFCIGRGSLISEIRGIDRK